MQISCRKRYALSFPGVQAKKRLLYGKLEGLKRKKVSRVQEPQLLSPCILEPSPEQEKPWQRESLTPQMESSLYSPQLVKSPCSKEDPASVQFSSLAQSCPTLCDPMDCSTPGLPAQHQLPEFTQTYVH